MAAWTHGMAVQADGAAQVSVRGDMGSFLRRWGMLYPDYMSRSIRHVAYLTQTRLKVELLARVPGGVEFPPISRIQRFRLLGERSRGGRLTKGPVPAHGLAYGMDGGDWPPGGRLAQSIRYRWTRGDMAADIGWLSPRSESVGVKFQRGQRTKVTARMRRMFFAAGLTIGRKMTIVQPPRPVFRPFFENRRGWMVERLVQRMRGHIARASADSYVRASRDAVFAGGRWTGLRYIG